MSRREGLGPVQLILIFAAAIAAISSVFIVQVHRSRAATCDRVTTIARDPKKVEYVKAWVASRTSDAQFMEAVRRNRSFEHTNPLLRRYIDLNWRYLGLAPNLAWIEFNMKAADTRNIDASGIGSVSLNEGRSSIIIQLNGADDLGLVWPPDPMSKLTRVGNGVFVYCQ